MKDRDFCNRLVSLRKAAGLTQNELEQRAELPTMVVSHYETGERAPGLQNIKALCKGLNCSATELLGV